MRTLPKISVITPSLNQARYIEKTIRSVLDQNYPNLEHIVVDGGSTDGTLEILKMYGSRLTWISGDIIAYLNSDDMYEPEALTAVAAQFMADPSVMWLSGRCRIIDGNDREVRSIITSYKNFLLDHYHYKLLLIANSISQPATFWKKEVVKEIGLFDPHESLVMDYEYWLRIGKRYQPAILDRNLAAFRVHPLSKTSINRFLMIQRECAVSRKYSRSVFINVLHYLHAVGMGAAYLIVDALLNLIRRRQAGRS
jgi:glycosyltransferase involved in cell wall biosynthesis